MQTVNFEYSSDNLRFSNLGARIQKRYLEEIRLIQVINLCKDMSDGNSLHMSNDWTKRFVHLLAKSGRPFPDLDLVTVLAHALCGGSENVDPFDFEEVSFPEGFSIGLNINSRCLETVNLSNFPSTHEWDGNLWPTVPWKKGCPVAAMIQTISHDQIHGATAKFIRDNWRCLDPSLMTGGELPIISQSFSELDKIRYIILHKKRYCVMQLVLTAVLWVGFKSSVARVTWYDAAVILFLFLAVVVGVGTDTVFVSTLRKVSGPCNVECKGFKRYLSRDVDGVYQETISWVSGRLHTAIKTLDEVLPTDTIIASYRFSHDRISESQPRVKTYNNFGYRLWFFDQVDCEIEDGNLRSNLCVTRPSDFEYEYIDFQFFYQREIKEIFKEAYRRFRPEQALNSLSKHQRNKYNHLLGMYRIKRGLCPRTQMSPRFNSIYKELEKHIIQVESEVMQVEKCVLNFESNTPIYEEVKTQRAHVEEKCVSHVVQCKYDNADLAVVRHIAPADKRTLTEKYLDPAKKDSKHTAVYKAMVKEARRIIASGGFKKEHREEIVIQKTEQVVTMVDVVTRRKVGTRKKKGRTSVDFKRTIAEKDLAMVRCPDVRKNKDAKRCSLGDMKLISMGNKLDNNMRRLKRKKGREKERLKKAVDYVSDRARALSETMASGIREHNSQFLQSVWKLASRGEMVTDFTPAVTRIATMFWTTRYSYRVHDPDDPLSSNSLKFRQFATQKSRRKKWASLVVD